MEKRKNIFTRILFNSKFLAFLGLVVIILISFPIAKNISQRYKINNEIRELQEEIESIEGKNTELRKFINYLSSEQYLEEQARLNFGLKKPGEEIAVIDIQDNINKKEPQNLENTNSDDEASEKMVKSIYNIPGLDKIQTKKETNNPQRWLEYFTGNK